MRLHTVALAALLLPACGLSEEQYQEGQREENCALVLDCADATTLEALGWSTTEDCVASYNSAQDPIVPEGCSYDSDAAAACLDEWAQLTCDDYPAGLPICDPWSC